MYHQGFGEWVSKTETRICPVCSKAIGSLEEFKDELSIKEYVLSGLCQKCQDSFFDEDEDVEDLDDLIIRDDAF